MIKNSKRSNFLQTSHSSVSTGWSVLWIRSSKQMSSVRELELLGPSWSPTLSIPCASLAPFRQLITRWRLSSEGGADAAVSGVSERSGGKGALTLALFPWGVWLCVLRYSSSMSFPSFQRFHRFNISFCTWTLWRNDRFKWKIANMKVWLQTKDRVLTSLFTKQYNMATSKPCVWRDQN